MVLHRVLLFRFIAALTASLILGGCFSVRIAARQAARNDRLASAAAPGEDIKLAGLSVSMWRPKNSGPAPLVIFSHGFHGSSRQSSFLMSAMAERGYLVLAPNHKDSRTGGGKLQPDVGFGQPGAWTDATYGDRRDDIVSLLNALRSDSSWSKQIDWNEVALAGHSLGGYTVLGMAGAWKTWKQPGIKAVLALSPYCAPFIKNSSLGGIDVPVMYQGGTLDLGITPSVIRPGGAYDQTPSPAYLVEFGLAGHLAWTDIRRERHDDIVYYSLAFLDKYLRGAKGDLTSRRSTVVRLQSK